MKNQRVAQERFKALGVSLVTCVMALSAASPIHEVSVQLFGQSCLLQGPLDELTLRRVHSISPEQLIPDAGLPSSSEGARSALEKVRSIQGLPSPLDTYRERMIRKLEATIAVIEALESLKSGATQESFKSSLKKFTSVSGRRALDEALRRSQTKYPDLRRSREGQEFFFEVFMEVIGDADEEFHRTIRKLSIQYQCEYSDETGSASDEVD